MMHKLCCVSVDLDEIPHYFHIHGLCPPEGLAGEAVYRTALPRFLSMAQHEGIPLTLFAVGADLVRPEAVEGLQKAHALGHEIANHSLDHRYDLTSLPIEVLREQIAGGIEAIQQAIGVPPCGFRAPGYTVDDRVFSVLQELGILYDSSVFPSPWYLGLKYAALARLSLLGRKSHSVRSPLSVLRAPAKPYRVGVPYWKEGSGLLELPIQVTPWGRFPFLGTALTLLGPAASVRFARLCTGEPLVNLELHGIDLLDVHDGLTPLARVQPDVRVSVPRKLETFHAVFACLRQAGYTFMTLQEASLSFG